MAASGKSRFTKPLVNKTHVILIIKIKFVNLHAQIGELDFKKYMTDQ